MPPINDLNHWICEQQTAFLELLENLVNINTFTANTAGVDCGMDVVCEYVERMGFHIEVIHSKHRLIKAGNGKGKRILLVAHMDTVHPPDGDFQVYTQQGDFASGPGVGDIKAGLVMGLWTLLAMDQENPDYNIQMVISADEELGSPSIQDWYAEGKSGADYAICLEPGFPQGGLSPDVPIGIVKQRKGTGRVQFTIRGKAAHAGGAWEQGISAIEAMAQRIIKIHALSDLERGITTNVGIVNGGTAANTIADSCKASVDFRYLTEKDGRETLDSIYEIINTPVIQRAGLDAQDYAEDVELNVFMPPMEYRPENQILLDTVLQEAARLGQVIVPIVRGGGSDANWISGSGIPVICGMGAAAEGIHTTEERILLPLTFDRLELLIASVYRLVNQQ
ncbi:MAG TPA: M20/M25/M40 family metallo-hydrolase [Aggregatilineales bacterium]|nr:M20/M25/M40 family metallo-hydrolase [Aggregatilineales bacterium]